MDKVKIGRTGITASRLGFGAMRLPQLDGGGGIDYELGYKMVDAAMEAGLNYFDTGYNYHGGMSEVFIGKALKKYPRDSYVLTTKLSLLALNRNPTREYAEQMFEEQMERLGVDYFDFYFIHNLSGDNQREMVDKFDLLGMVAERQRQGRLRHIGFSSHEKAEDVYKTLDLYDWDLAQYQINYFDWEHQNAKLAHDTFKERGVPMVFMEPLRGGQLVSLAPAAEAVLRKCNPDETNASWALRWAANETDATIVLSGMSAMRQVEENLVTFSPVKPFTDAERAAINEAARILNDIPLVGCTACGYCMPCPSGVKIPDNFRMYNDYIRFNDLNSLKARHKRMMSDGNSGAEGCVACGECVKACTQDLNIPELLEKIATLASAPK
ncbi:MAG: aldo/keto reductase [Oscillospiraceae bacterium]|nr:aldo/keto reductase [Oscillospiraceae bacterium]